MNTNAVYVIREDGKEFFFRTEYAGGFSYPFETAGYLNSLKYALQKSNIREQKICIAPLLAQMRGTRCFPDSLNNTLLFEEITEETALEQSVLKDIPFIITLDVNLYTVAFHFNEQYEEFCSFTDIVFPCFDPKNKYSGGCFMNEALSRLTETDNIPFEEAAEMIFRELIEQAIAEQRR